MQIQFNIHEAKTRLSQLIEQVEAGGEAVIARAGKPVVRLVRMEEQPEPRVLGRLAGRYVISADADHPVPETPTEFIDALEGR
jgi:prevent-host-death family protein